jgi:hypothetical protein
VLGALYALDTAGGERRQGPRTGLARSRWGPHPRSFPRNGLTHLIYCALCQLPPTVSLLRGVTEACARPDLATPLRHHASRVPVLEVSSSSSLHHRRPTNSSAATNTSPVDLWFIINISCHVSVPELSRPVTVINITSPMPTRQLTKKPSKIRDREPLPIASEHVRRRHACHFHARTEGEKNDNRQSPIPVVPPFMTPRTGSKQSRPAR